MASQPVPPAATVRDELGQPVLTAAAAAPLSTRMTWLWAVAALLLGAVFVLAGALLFSPVPPIGW
ncbi:hypothetical protein LV457_00720 [Mycobacterium sp. MYCO198283]|uniref:hypothetical protein n=1 Tax=Mycobacterium sp. MYCO198283 TaxID=2883505 RepID=UPI001E2DD4CE|nr:hypothetical protein [Mycobacterium sp. MYCO198283]MCG5430822.1 hypothetical protein [Mycobacterium sp. MYCO198283]